MRDTKWRNNQLLSTPILFFFFYSSVTSISRFHPLGNCTPLNPLIWGKDGKVNWENNHAPLHLFLVRSSVTSISYFYPLSSCSLFIRSFEEGKWKIIMRLHHPFLSRLPVASISRLHTFSSCTPFLRHKPSLTHSFLTSADTFISPTRLLTTGVALFSPLLSPTSCL